MRLFAQWAPSQGPAPDTDLAQRLGHWVSAFDAIGLQAAHKAIQAVGAPVPAGMRASRPAGNLADDFARARGALVQAISLPPTLPNEFTYAAYKRRHLELQRQMEQMVGALREHVRETLARGALSLRQLAALDAALEKVIARREQALLPLAVALLERRFEQLRKAHAAQVKADAAEDDPMTWRRAGAWLHTFENDWRQVLLAELDLRLEPVAGLVEATGTELTHPQ